MYVKNSLIYRKEIKSMRKSYKNSSLALCTYFTFQSCNKGIILSYISYFYFQLRHKIRVIQ